MKNISSRIFAIALAAVMLTAMLTGCKSGEPDDGGSGSEPGNTQAQPGSTVRAAAETGVVFVPEKVPLPDEIGEIRQITYNRSDGRVYFSAAVYEHRNDSSGGSSYQTFTTELYVQSIDGTNITALTGYASPAARPEGINGGVHISSMCFDDDGNLWVAETVDFYTLDLPEGFNTEADSYADYMTSTETGTYIRKLDPATGSELHTLGTGGLPTMNEDSGISKIAVDSQGYIYLNAYNWVLTKQEIYAMDDTGKVLLHHELEGLFVQLVRLLDGSIAFADGVSFIDNIPVQRLQKMDASRGAFGESIEIPVPGARFDSSRLMADFQVYAGGEGYDVLINDNMNLYGYTAESEGAVGIIDWFESGISFNSIQDMAVVSGSDILCINYTWDNTAKSGNYNINVLKMLQRTEFPEKNELILATLYMYPGSYIHDLIMEFNETNPYYVIKIVDYMQDINTGRITMPPLQSSAPTLSPEESRIFSTQTRFLMPIMREAAGLQTFTRS